MIKQLFIIGLALCLSACNFLAGDEGVFRDRGGDYTQAEILPPMAIPQELDSYTIDQLYVIPEQLVATVEVFDQIPMPKPIETKRREGVIIQNLADRRWIVIDATPGQVWPLVRDYWTELQIVLDYENRSSGIMVTGWVESDHRSCKSRSEPTWSRTRGRVSVACSAVSIPSAWKDWRSSIRVTNDSRISSYTRYSVPRESASCYAKMPGR